MRRKAGPFPNLKAAAAHYLGRYASSAENLKRVLARRVQRWVRLSGNAAPDDAAQQIEEAVAAAMRAGLIDDAAFAAGRARTLRQRGWGARRISAALKQKGVGKTEIDAALNGDTEEMEEAAALRFAERRRLGPWRPAGARAEKRQKDIAALMRAGFGLSLARKVIDTTSEET